VTIERYNNEDKRAEPSCKLTHNDHHSSLELPNHLSNNGVNYPGQHEALAPTIRERYQTYSSTCCTSCYQPAMPRPPLLHLALETSSHSPEALLTTSLEDCKSSGIYCHAHASTCRSGPLCRCRCSIAHTGSEQEAQPFIQMDAATHERDACTAGAR
jgi:hypothetical protein